jgi:methanethiol S-methyltransferase
MAAFQGLFSLISYGVFLVSFLYAIGFVAGVGVPKSIDTPAGAWGWEGFAIDTVLLGLFALQHSVMARPGFKRWWTRFVPPAIERSIYVLLSSLLLLLIFALWRPLAVPVWDLRGASPGIALWVVQALGWVVVLLSTFMISHFELFGLTQAWRHWRGRAPHSSPFKEALLYRFVRHPIMLGFVVAFWSTPFMTLGHLWFALLTTGYILVGVQLEERDLLRAFGATYASYRERVPMLIPWPRRHRARAARDPAPQR